MKEKGIRRISPQDIGQAGPEAAFVDVRSPGEFAGRRLSGSINIPFSRLEAESARLDKDKPVVLLCARGMMAKSAAHKLEALGFRDIRVVEGGLKACQAVQTLEGEGGAWPMERQVRLAAGSLVLIGATLGWFFHPAFWLLSAGVGAGLVYSALTDTCGMAALLALMPWNRR